MCLTDCRPSFNNECALIKKPAWQVERSQESSKMFSFAHLAAWMRIDVSSDILQYWLGYALKMQVIELPWDNNKSCQGCSCWTHWSLPHSGRWGFLLCRPHSSAKKKRNVVICFYFLSRELTWVTGIDRQRSGSKSQSSSPFSIMGWNCWPSVPLKRVIL